MVKNTLAERAAKGTKVEEALKGLTGVTSIAYTEGDPVALAKALAKYAKDNPEFTFKAGLVEGRVISIKEIQALATMPSKEEIYSKLLFLINAPAQRLVTVMNAVGRDLAVVINQGVEKGKFKESERNQSLFESSVIGAVCWGFARFLNAGLSWRTRGNLVALEPWATDSEIKLAKLKNKWRITWRICSSWKNQS